MGLFFEKDDVVERERPKAFNAQRGLTASAVRIDLSSKEDVDRADRRLKTELWQQDCWEMYDLTGEIHFPANMLADVLSRIRLYPGYITDNATIPSHLSSVDDVDDYVKDYAAQALQLLSSGNGGVSGLLRDAALNLFIAGEYYLVKEPARPSKDIPERWSVRSVSEVIVEGKSKEGDAPMFLKPRRNSPKDEWTAINRKDNFVARMWRTHPRFTDEADSSIRPNLELLDELLLLNRLARQTARKRLNAGILFVPDDVDNIFQSDGDMDETGDQMADGADDNHQSFQEEFIQSIIGPLENEDDGASVVPMLVRGPKELADMIKHIKIESTMDTGINVRQEKVIDRILVGLAIPKDIVTGLASVKYSNAVMIDETLYKAHIEPMMLMIVDQLTNVFYRRLLKLWGVPEDVINKMVIWYDPSAITTKPSKAESASEGYEKGIISAEAWRRAHAFSETDAPTEVEKAWRLAETKGLISEPVFEMILKLAMPTITDLVRKQELEQNGGADQTKLQEAIDTPVPDDIIEPDDNQAPPTDLVEP